MDTPISWTGPEDLGELEGYALALCVRNMGTGLTDRKSQEGLPPSKMDRHMVDALASAMAYIKHRIDTTPGMRTWRDLDTLLLHHCDEMQERINIWIARNPRAVEAYRRRLYEIERAGFVCQ